MKKEDIPFYNDPEDFENGVAIKYPCNTQYMVYNPMLHRYFLTQEALIHNGIDVSEFSNNTLNDFLQKVSKKVYDYIFFKSGFRLYQVMMYRIATAPPTIYPDQYYMRKQFEEALIYEAKFLIQNGDPAEVSLFNLEKNESVNDNMSNDDTRDMSQETIRTLDTLNLTRWFAISKFRLDLDKY